jgi:transglutaminase-like putative cysteine protease
MPRPLAILVIVLLLAVLAGCSRDAEHSASSDGPKVVIEDIEAGIRKHIDDRIHDGDGYFALSFGDQDLRLKLVRVHTEYLANLGPGRHFACVDLVDVSGDLYDVDFFLQGDPGAMTVSETTVHKINGQPYYAWEQREDGTWQRIPVESASAAHLGVVRVRDEFEFIYRATMPEIAAAARIWAPLATSDAFQTVDVTRMDLPADHRVLREKKYGNHILFMELGPEHSGELLEIQYQVVRREKAAYEADAPDPGEYLTPDRLVPGGQDFEAIAREVVEKKKETALVRARALYDHTIDRMSYIKAGDGWGEGDAVYACDARTGNCSDFHSYFMALARSIGIPVRFTIGAGIPSERNKGGIDGYHCWVEFYADGKWWPVDISEGDKYSSLATYYFGHHPANRLALSHGRDLVVDPAPVSGPINFLAYPLLEVDGRPVRTRTEFLFRRDGPLPTAKQASVPSAQPGTG